MTQHITKDTRLCISLAARPGNFGTRFHNYLYEALNLDYIYKAFSTADLPGAIAGVRALDIRGCSVSMPFKEACIPLLDSLDVSAAAIQSVNTIVNDGGTLRGYNTDYIAVIKVLKHYQVPTSTSFALRGSGGMAKAVACALRDSGFKEGCIVARNEEAGQLLATSCGFEWRPDPGSVCAGLLINATPIGMSGGPEAAELAFSTDAIAAATTVVDVVALPAQTPLIRAAQGAGKATITGNEVIALQALEQFVLYTGQRPSTALVSQAAAFARKG